MAPNRPTSSVDESVEEIQPFPDHPDELTHRKQHTEAPQVDANETTGTKDKMGTNDAGNKSSDHYKSRLSSIRYNIRSLCLPIVRKETEVLANIQSKVRGPWLDYYFAWTANLASHTFYVLMLPVPIWFGMGMLSRDLVAVLGYGIYVSGFFKDFLCLPRPRSPPLHRITMSSYTTQEYGWPSSHSANATAVTLILFAKLWDYMDSFSTLQVVSLSALLLLYYFSLIVGRLYCGMHGFFDILTGAAIGASLFAFRRYLAPAYDTWLLLSSRNDTVIGIIGTVILIVLGHLYLIHIYPEPVDDCPCFDDSVAFVGVLIGLDLSHLFFIVTERIAPGTDLNTILSIPWSFEKHGVFLSALRMALGIILVVIWKAISKPVLFTILPPLYKFLGIYLPRKQYMPTAHSHKTSRQIRSQSLSNMVNEPLMDVNKALKSVREGDSDNVGPTDDIDAYELLDYGKSHPSEPKVEVSISGVFRPRYDVEIIGRTIVYAGIPIMATWGFITATEIFKVN
ncbi:hypothetical protein FT663_04061 [Candidozyma haemuli var. vulneris]|uniref:Phosphatidic acid phosphatase type 2/haloperoxidase domain-containing protein n=1 Tax=Candidozyma haemuli TaxID=45357 RepID=A0A2V1APM4_9ASCO|nr:hypothetical protein CXQ85_001203 [[Candida] haemuloni]KAF3988301.1 hypothetical protein FT662_03497 [[Candida] haemuloni var. vulneris]KAF3988378.1 hypothetical protein FT663_04061 [[Candida] haemuloni var. vulneris]PVH18911.1 hypothetical protein CXQ85_001203 [[Candida] haemuloni]